MEQEEKKIKLYMRGAQYNHDGTEAEYVEVPESEQFALYAMGWKASEESILPE
ncbi:hypothetical protein [Klebsiella pneumoniae]|uniref:hypothetical protein n=1 Tax=Klebsiella pneumoniae TaxID=573 RepID=UPI00130461CA|nr:hypothetical protein [Klebsiella pneumoniae]MCS6333949.1 hypothetical protein [Klebsiella pneumoniae]HEN4881648.1 hypothetical protein [Klebsiella pneumoniae]